MGTVGKALDLLDLFTHQRPSAGLSEIARLAGLNKATCHRLLTEMESRGLAEATGETAHMSHLVAGRLQTLAFAYSARHGMKVMMEDADFLPFHATASGMAVLAFLPGPAQQDALSAPLPRLTAATETAPEVLSARLPAIRANGYSETASTFETDVHGIAVPLFDARAACVGALAVATPVPRMTVDLRARILAEVTGAGARITLLWGGRLPPELANLWRAAA